MHFLHSNAAETAYKELMRACYFCGMDERSLKDHIRHIREDLGMTQEEFALELGIDGSTYWRLEEGRTRLISPYLYKIADFARMEVADLVAGKNLGRILEESEDMKEKLEAQKDFYEQKLSERDATIANLNHLIASMRK